MENEVSNVRIVPLVRYEKVMKNGKDHTVVRDNLTSRESANMSCECKMFVENADHVYIVPEPLVFHGGTGIKGLLCYLYDDMNKEEQEKYFERSIVIPAIVKKEDVTTKKRWGLRRKR